MKATRILVIAVAVCVLTGCSSLSTQDDDGPAEGVFSGGPGPHRSNPPPDALGEGDEKIPEFGEYLRENGIDEAYSPESLTKLASFVETWLDELDRRLSEIDAAEEQGETTAELKKEKKKIKERKVFLKFCSKNLQRVQAPGSPESARISAFQLGKRMTYVAATMRPDEEPRDLHQYLLRRFAGVENLAKNLKRHVFRDCQFKIPYLEEAELGRPLGDERAELEARFLVDAADPGSFVPSARLARMTPEEVAALDIGEGHPVWHTRAYMAEHPDTWRELEAWVEKRITKKLSKSHDLKKTFPDFSYRLATARKVLFFDKIKDTATSPKIKSVDSFGIDWKIKWGDEVQPEAVGNRLWMKLGGKFTDLLYVNGVGREHLVLVLADPGKAGKKGDSTCYPLTYEDLAGCLLQSKYEFNLDPYLYETGTLSEDNVASILSDLPEEALEGYRLEDLIGRDYVTFRETLVEVGPPKSVVRRGGATSFSGLGARRDRVARALFVFNMWIWNQDAKDDNNRGLLLKDFEGDGYTYVETQHDFGVSLGGLISYGEINKMQVGDAFARVGGRFTPEIYFRQSAYYYPKAWGETTFADGLWMARQLAALNRADMEEVVAQTLWPDFMQQALTYKLVARRNQIAGLFHLEVPAGDEVSPVIFEVSLAGVEDRRAAADRYHVDPAWIEEAMRKAGLLDRGFRDQLVKEGQVSKCEETILIGILERHLHPSGLSKRVSRFFDDKAGDRGCEYHG
ncbi:MAG: hypothetical protein GY856_38430 [bacterium]|nr:hypothetical protein [bacterium]